MKTNFLLTNVCAVAVTLLCAFSAQNAQASLGTAVGDNVALYGQDDSKGGKPNFDAPSTNTLSYRVVEVDGSLFALVTASAEMTGDDWAAQLRDYGVSGNDGKSEMKLTERNGASVAYNLTGYPFPENGGTTRQMQIFVNFKEGGFAVTDLFSFEKGKVNNPSDASVAPVLDGEVTYSVNDAKMQCAITLPPVSGNQDCFYLVSDAVAGVSQVYFFAGEQTLSLSSGTTYNLKIEAIDYNGNRSAAQTVSFATAFDTSANLALGRPVSASTGNATLAVDGNEGTRWESAAADTEWWEVELSNAFNLDYIEIKWEGAYSKHFEIQTKLNESDEWTSKDVTYDGGNGLLQTISMVGTPAKYIRFQGVERATGYGNSFYEFRVYATSVYDPSTADALASVSLSPHSGAIFCGETFSFIAEAFSGTGAVVADAVFTVQAPENCTVRETAPGTYEFTSDVAGEYVVTVKAASKGVEVSHSIMITVSERPVLTSLQLKESQTTVGVVGRKIDLLLTALDQYGKDFACQPEFVITGDAGGAMEGNAYIASTVGSDRIKAVVGSVESNELTIDIVAQGGSLSLGMNVTANEGATDVANAVDGNYGSLAVLHGNTAEDEASRTYNAFITVDLAPVEPVLGYRVDLLEVDWEGATAADYTVDFSNDGNVWTTAYEMVGGAGMVSRHDAFYPAAVVYAATESDPVRYVRLNVTKAATQYGVKVREIAVYGTAVYPTSVESALNDGTRVWQSGSLLCATADVCAVELYNAAGVKVAASVGNTVDMSALAQGVYIVRLATQAGQVVVTKIVR